MLVSLHIVCTHAVIFLTSLTLKVVPGVVVVVVRLGMI